MGMLRSLFGPSKEEIWRQLAREMKAQYVEDARRGCKVEARHGEWTITLDTHTVSTGRSCVTYTRLRAPYVNADEFRFTLYRKGIFTGIAKYFGMQDIEIGDAFFDEHFVIQSSNIERTVAFFGNPRIRELIEQQPMIYLITKDDEGWFGQQFPEGVDELCFTSPEIVKDVERLKGLYELFAESLNQLCHIGSAYENDPKLKLK